MKTSHSIVIASLLAGASAQAQLYVIDSGTPDSTSAASVFYTSPSNGQILAQQFTLAVPTEVSHIDVFLGGFGNPLNVQLATQIGPGATAGDVLTSFTLPSPFLLDFSGVWTGTDVSLNLAAGDYYLVFSGTSSGALPTKAPNDIGPSFYASQGNGDINEAFPPGSTYLQWGDGTTQFGVRIATPVPEPATTAMMTAAGLAGFACLRRRWKAA